MEATVSGLAANGRERPFDVQSSSAWYRIHVAVAEDRYRIVACGRSTLDATGENESRGSDDQSGASCKSVA